MSIPQVTKELALMRVLLALAWADGEVSAEERSFLGGLITEFGFPETEARELERLMDQPIPLDRFEELVRAFRETTADPDDVQQLLSRAERLIEADRRRSQAETRRLSLLKEWLREEGRSGPRDSAAGSHGFLERLREVLGGTRSGEKPAISSIVEDLAGRMHARAGSEGFATIADSGRRHYVTLFGALLYRVIYADRIVQPEEAKRLREVLANDFDLADGEVEYVIRLIQKRVAEDIDRQRLCADFNRITGLGERLTLLKALFAIAQADGEVSEEEATEIRLISNYLWIDVQDFVRIRRKVLGAGKDEDRS